MNTPLRRALLMAALSALTFSPAWAAVDPALEKKILHVDGAAYDRFGVAAALSADGGIALIGATGVNSETGAAYVFTRTSLGFYLKTGTLTASDSSIEDLFGASAALSADGRTALVSAPVENISRGALYVFTRPLSGSWQQVAKLTASDGEADNYLGGAVALSANGWIALAGASYDNDKGSFSGSAYIFSRTRSGIWVQTKLTAGDGAASDHFGGDVALSADGATALIGASGDDSGKGSAYVFMRDENGIWQQTGKLIANDGAAADYFGGSVALSADGGMALIGAGGDDDKGTNAGAAYVFTRGATGLWSRTAKLTAADGAAYDSFGGPLSLAGDGTTALMAAVSDDDKGTNSGSAYVFTRSGGVWRQTVKLTGSDGMAGDTFGRSAALSADSRTALLGAWGRNEYTGLAYVFGSRPPALPPMLHLLLRKKD